MSCKGRICCRAVFSQSVTLAGGTVIINIPQRSFNNGERICLFVTQSIPATAPINAPVVVTIGESATQYNLVKCNCEQVTACGIRSRRRYPLRVVGTTFRVLGNLCCAPSTTVQSIPVEEVTTEGGAT